MEGELQGVVDGLHKTRYYMQGCDKLLVGVDHKPLLGLFHGKLLEDIDNMRLRRLVEKTYGWSFKVVNIPGRKHAAPGEYQLIQWRGNLLGKDWVGALMPVLPSQVGLVVNWMGK